MSLYTSDTGTAPPSDELETSSLVSAIIVAISETRTVSLTEKEVMSIENVKRLEIFAASDGTSWAPKEARRVRR